MQPYLHAALQSVAGIEETLSEKWWRRITVSGMSASAQTTSPAKVESCSLGERALPK
ncbi:MAG: hypothetical protein ACPGN3_17745 [Opitutales bacterium]